MRGGTSPRARTRASGRSISFSTLQPGPTSTVPRPTRRRRGPSTCPARSGSCELDAPVVYYSTDYVFDGRKREPYVESDPPDPQSVYGRSKLEGEREIGEGWIVRTSWLFGWTGHNFVRTMLELGRRTRGGAGRRRPARLPDLRRASRRGDPEHRRAAVRPLPRGRRRRLHVGRLRRGDLRGGRTLRAASFASRREELGRPAPRPANSVLRSEKPAAPALPHWREGLRECLARSRPKRVARYRP